MGSVMAGRSICSIGRSGGAMLTRNRFRAPIVVKNTGMFTGLRRLSTVLLGLALAAGPLRPCACPAVSAAEEHRHDCCAPSAGIRAAESDCCVTAASSAPSPGVTASANAPAPSGVAFAVVSTTHASVAGSAAAAAPPASPPCLVLRI